MATGPRGAVSFYPTDHPALSIGVKNRLTELLRAMQVDLGSGIAQDWPDYKYRCGVLNGLTTAIAMCDEILSEMSER
jgi:hypothetical protein